MDSLVGKCRPDSGTRFARHPERKPRDPEEVAFKLV
jgi:hypothetical protein